MPYCGGMSTSDEDRNWLIGRDELPPTYGGSLDGISRLHFYQHNGFGIQVANVLERAWMLDVAKGATNRNPRGVWISPVVGDAKQVQKLVSYLEHVGSVDLIDLRPKTAEHFVVTKQGAKIKPTRYPKLKVPKKMTLVEARDTAEWQMTLRIEPSYATRTIEESDRIILGDLSGYRPDRKTHDYDQTFTRLQSEIGQTFSPESFEIEAGLLLKVLANGKPGMRLRARRESGRSIVGRLWADDQLIWEKRNMRQVVVFGEGGRDNIEVVTGRQRKTKSGTTWPKATGPTSWRNSVQWDDPRAAAGRSRQRWQVTALPAKP